MVAAFGSGAMFSLVSGMGAPNQPANAVTSGLFFALVQGGLFKVLRIELIISKDIQAPQDAYILVLSLNNCYES